ncbi:ABC transporter ATP-binding protein/permease [Oscillospiraceae bacterium OttesenSCG-928-F05]|nr:ABC transporter ATP-binding protein/permease [Oscillospiraceae bacterium OttesenSCG-928-F05]
MKKKEKQQSGLSQSIAYAGSRKPLIYLGCALSGVAAVLGIAPYVCVWLVARDALAVFPDLAAPNLARWGWMAVWFAVGNVVVYFAALLCTHLAAFRTARNIRKTLMRHIVKLPLGFFVGSQSGILRKQIDENAGLTEDMLAHKLPDLTAAIVTPVAAIVVLFVFDWVMGLLCLLPMLIAIMVMINMMSGDNATFFHQYQLEIEKMSGEAVEYVRGIPVVKVFQQTVYSFKAFYNAILSYSDLAGKYSMSCRTGQTIFLTSINGAFALLVPAALLLASGGNVQAALVNFIFYVLFAPACGGMLNRIMYASDSIRQTQEAMFKLNRILAESPLPEAANPKTPQGADIEFRNVSFSYPGTEKPALSHVSFSVPQNSTVALVGPSGGGKTTAASLIPRFWDVQEGAVLIGGVDVRDMAGDALMKQVAFVFQDTKLFKKSLYENIRSSRPDATREEVLAAARAAQCGDILEKLPWGIDTVVGAEGVYLSGGEAQRVALARAILKDAPIIVLDEATAFADPENEHQIQKAFEELTRGKTVLMIAHRLSTIQNADQILVLEGGAVAEQGTQARLLERKGKYAAMWADYQRAARWKVGNADADKEAAI